MYARDYSSTPIVICLDELVHTTAQPWCDDLTCPCHDALDELTEQEERRLDAQAQESYESPYQQFLESIVNDAEYNAYLDHMHTPRAEYY